MREPKCGSVPPGHSTSTCFSSSWNPGLWVPSHAAGPLHTHPQCPGRRLHTQHATSVVSLSLTHTHTSLTHSLKLSVAHRLVFLPSPSIYGAAFPIRNHAWCSVYCQQNQTLKGAEVPLFSVADRTVWANTRTLQWPRISSGTLKCCILNLPNSGGRPQWCLRKQTFKCVYGSCVYDTTVFLGRASQPGPQRPLQATWGGSHYGWGKGGVVKTHIPSWLLVGTVTTEARFSLLITLFTHLFFAWGRKRLGYTYLGNSRESGVTFLKLRTKRKTEGPSINRQT